MLFGDAGCNNPALSKRSREPDPRQLDILGFLSQSQHFCFPSLLLDCKSLAGLLISRQSIYIFVCKLRWERAAWAPAELPVQPGTPLLVKRCVNVSELIGRSGHFDAYQRNPGGSMNHRLKSDEFMDSSVHLKLEKTWKYSHAVELLHILSGWIHTF